jgi:hypothetical protein
MTPEEVRALAVSLPGTTEQPHHERTSFRAGGRIFATMPPDGASVNILLGEEDARAAAEEHPDVVTLLWWGKKLSGVTVELARVDEPALAEAVRELLQEAWAARASRERGR